MDGDTLHNTIDDQSDGIPTVSGPVDEQSAPNQQEGAGVLASPVESLRPDAVDPFQMAFSVYTATNGYDWSNIPEGSERADLDFYYRKAVERKPDFMSSGDVVKGVFACNNIIAAFCIQVIKHWDSFGRDADYCAFAFLPYEDAYRVDFDALLAMPEFTTAPRHDPPTSISYFGEASKDINSEDSVAAIKKLYGGESLHSFDFAKIGALLSVHGNKCASWLFCKVECAIENSIMVSTGTWNDDPYPPPPPPPPPSLPPPEDATGIRLSVAEPMVPVALPEVTLAPQPSPLTVSSDSQVTHRTDVVDTCLRAQIPASSVRVGYRAPAVGHIHSARGGACVMTPVSQEEMNRSAIQKSSGLFGLDTLTLVLMGVCSFLVAVLLSVLLYFFMTRNEPLSFGDAAGVVDVTKDFDGTQIKSLGEDKSNPRFEKGDK